MRDGTAHGNEVKGSKHPKAKLNEKLVVGIRASLKMGASVGAMARKYDVNRRTIQHLRDRVTWKHV